MLQQFLHDFGYFALFLGTFFEGETILVLAGFLAFRGYMDINLVVVVAFFGSYAGDQLWYFLGRKHGRKLLARKPRWQMMGDRALEHVLEAPASSPIAWQGGRLSRIVMELAQRA